MRSDRNIHDQSLLVKISDIIILIFQNRLKQKYINMTKVQTKIKDYNILFNEKHNFVYISILQYGKTDQLIVFLKHFICNKLNR